MYNNEFKDYEELEEIVNDFMEEINNEVSQGTNEKPVDRIKRKQNIYYLYQIKIF